MGVRAYDEKCADDVVSALRSSLYSQRHDSKTIIAGLNTVLEENIWRRRFVRRIDQWVEFSSFDEFVQTPPLEGLGSSIETLEAFARSDTRICELLDRARQRSGGRPTEETVYNIHGIDERPSGTSRAAALRRIRKDRPDLLERVLAGELSANAAAVEAGFRRRLTTIEQVQRLLLKLDASEVAQVLEWANACLH